MKIDKSKGYWCQYKSTTELDDIAYQLYINYYYEIYSGQFASEPGPQSSFMNQKNDLKTLSYQFYKNAIKEYRKLKLQKLCLSLETK